MKWFNEEHNTLVCHCFIKKKENRKIFKVKGFDVMVNYVIIFFKNGWDWFILKKVIKIQANVSSYAWD